MTAPDPAALLAAMEAAAQKARQSDCAFAYISVSDLAALCAALRASQEREAAAVAALQAAFDMRVTCHPVWEAMAASVLDDATARRGRSAAP